MYAATKAWIDPKNRMFYIGGFKEFTKKELMNEAIDSDYLLSQWSKAMNGKRVNLTREGSATKELSVLSVGFANNYLTKNISGSVKAYHPRRDFGNPPGFIIAMPGVSDFGAGIMDKQNPYPFHVGLFEAIEEVIRQNERYTFVPQLTQASIPKGLEMDVTDLNELIYQRIEETTKNMKKGGAAINLNELISNEAYIANPVNSWRLIVEDGLGKYEMKVLLAPEMEEKTPVKNVNFVLGGLVNLLSKNQSIAKTNVWDGEYMIRGDKVIYFHRMTDVFDVLTGQAWTFKNGKVIEKSNINSVIRSILAEKELVMEKHGISLEYADHVATPKVEVYYKNGLNPALFNKTGKPVNTPLKALSM